MEPQMLERIGLTSGESRVYLALLKLGSTKTGALAMEAGVSSSKVYKILDRLISKGIAGYAIKGKVKYFSPMDPGTVLNYLEDEKKKIDESKDYLRKIMPQLELQRKSSEKSEAVIFHGLRGVTNLFRTMLDELEKGDEYNVIGAGAYQDTPGKREFFANYHRLRAERGVRLKMIANHDARGDLVPMTLRLSEIRYLPQYLITNMQITFYKDRSFIVLWKKSPIGFFIDSKDVTDGFRGYFKAFWKTAKK